MRRRWTTMVVALILAIALIGGAFIGLASLTHTTAPYDPGASASPSATVPPQDDLAEYYRQKLDWAGCTNHSGDQCAFMRVPLDYQNPSGRTIEIAVLSHPAEKPSQRIGALVVNPGGPGVSGADFAASASNYFPQAILDRFDIVGFDPRGVGKSDPIDCLSDADLDTYVASEADAQTPAQVSDVMSWNAKFGAGCVKLSGDLAGHVSTVEAAKDMDVLRAALGETKLDYYGGSYGTELGTVYADLFPKNVAHFVLDGAIDPTLSLTDFDLQQASSMQEQLHTYAEGCVSNKSCTSLGANADAVVATIGSLLDQVNAKPMPAGKGRVLTEGTAFYGVIAPLYSPSDWQYLTLSLQAAQKNDGSQLLSLADWYTDRNADGTYADNSMEALYAITCIDDPTYLTPDQVQKVLPQFEAASPTFGAVFAWSMTGCSGWTAKADEKQPPVKAAGAGPIVVIGTSGDPVTPAPWAKHLASMFDSGIYVEREGNGHTALASGNACIDSLISKFFVNGTAPAANTQCS